MLQSRSLELKGGDGEDRAAEAVLIALESLRLRRQPWNSSQGISGMP
jgi:hypothetical protein